MKRSFYLLNIGLMCVLMMAKLPPNYTKVKAEYIEEKKYTKVEYIKEETRTPLTYTIPEQPFYNVKVIASAYDNCYICTQNFKNKGITASGIRASRGSIAAPTSIPFNTRMNIEGLGTYTVHDRGEAIVKLPDGSYKIDIWFPTHKQALDFGVKELKARIIPNVIDGN